MRDSWATLSLGEVAEVLDRMRKPISGAEREKRLGKVPYYGATGLTGWIDKPLFNEELVLLGEDAIDFLNPDVHKAYLIDGPSWVNNHAHVLRARKNIILSYFLMEALNAVDYSKFVAFGTRSKLTQGSMMGIRIPVPPLLVQRRIVDLVASIDAYIAGLEKQVEAARTARNAILHELLTAGGDDWTETTFGGVAEWFSGGTPKAGKAEFYDGGTIPWVVIADMAETEIHTTAKSITQEGLREIGGRLAPAGSVLISMYATVGRAAIAHLPVATNQAIAWSIPNQAVVLPRLLLFVAQLLEPTVAAMARGATQKNINREILRNVQFLLPPMAEQERIVEIVTSIDDVIGATEQAFTDAKRLRSGLLTDLLSGEHEIPESYDKFLGAA
jgi:type I restriction enzyme S subunit